MGTTLASPSEMIEKGARRLIHSDKQLAEYTDALFQLTARKAQTNDDEEQLSS